MVGGRSVSRLDAQNPLPQVQVDSSILTDQREADPYDVRFSHFLEGHSRPLRGVSELSGSTQADPYGIGSRWAQGVCPYLCRSLEGVSESVALCGIAESVRCLHVAHAVLSTVRKSDDVVDGRCLHVLHIYVCSAWLHAQLADVVVTSEYLVSIHRFDECFALSCATHDPALFG